MKMIELNKLGLTPMSETEKIQTSGGGFWRYHEKFGYVVGVVIGTSLRLANDMAKKLFERSALR